MYTIFIYLKMFNSNMPTCIKESKQTMYNKINIKITVGVSDSFCLFPKQNILANSAFIAVIGFAKIIIGPIRETKHRRKLLWM